MFRITSQRRSGEEIQHHVKPLQIIWSKFPQWSSANTVHVDDLARNFALNRGSGLKIKAFHRKKGGRRDLELLGLTKYLEQLALSQLSFDDVDFNDWTDVVQGRRELIRKPS